jgi:ssDNA-specific exonuclease RecJ
MLRHFGETQFVHSYFKFLQSEVYYFMPIPENNHVLKFCFLRKVNILLC